MNRIGGYNLAPEILYRWHSGMDIVVPNRPDHVAVRLWAAPRLEDMYGNPKGSGVTGDPSQRRLVGQCRSGDLFFTSSMSERVQVATDRTSRHARFVFALGDLTPPLLEDEVCYLAAQQVLVGNRAAEAGPAGARVPLLGFTLIVPPDPVFGLAEPNIHFQGVAPSGTGAILGVPFSATTDLSQQVRSPPLLVALPQQSSGITLRTDTDGLVYSFDWGMPATALSSGVPVEIASSVKYMLFASTAGKPISFSADTSSFRFSH